MKIYVVTDGIGQVLTAERDVSRAYAVAEGQARKYGATEFEWRPDGCGSRAEMRYRAPDTGRWNTVPKRYLQVVELEES